MTIRNYLPRYKRKAKVLPYIPLGKDRWRNSHCSGLIMAPKSSSTFWEWSGSPSTDSLRGKIMGIKQLLALDLDTKRITPRKTNMEPENEPLEEEIPTRNH